VVNKSQLFFMPKGVDEIMKGFCIFIFLLIQILASLSCTKEMNKANVEKQDIDKYHKVRKKMVEEQIIARNIKDKLVIDAMLRIQRHNFVPEKLIDEAYNDYPLPIGEDQTISQPYIVALMTELLGLKGNEKVLEIGTGSGYQAAILAEIAKEVYTIEIISSLAKSAEIRLKSMGYKNIAIRAGDGYKGWPEHAPFDCIMVTAAPEHIPAPLVNQLKVGGKLVIPVGSMFQELKVITKTVGGYEEADIIPVRFVPMTGEAQEGNK